MVPGELEGADGGGRKKLIRAWGNAVAFGGRIPGELAWVAVMDRVGGYEGYVALCGDAAAYDDVVLVMRAEAEAQEMLRLKARSGRRE